MFFCSCNYAGVGRRGGEGGALCLAFIANNLVKFAVHLSFSLL